MKRFSKTFSLTILVIAMAFALVGCKTAEVAEAPVAVTPVEAPAPVVEAPAAEAPAPVVEAPAPVVEAVAEPQALVMDLNYGPFTATIEVYDGLAYITYPAFVTTEEMVQAASAAYAAYGPYLQGTTLVITEPGKATLTFPQGYTVDDFDFAKEILAKEVAWYIDSLFAAPAVEEVVEVAAVVEEPVAQPIVKTVDLFGYQATISYIDQVATITYPSFITNAEVAQAAKAAYAAYGPYLQGTALAIDNGVAYLTLPVEITEADVDFAVAALEQELPYYVASLFAAPAEEVKVVAEEKVEEVVEAVEEVVAEVVETVEEVVAEVVEEAKTVVEEVAQAATSTASAAASAASSAASTVASTASSAATTAATTAAAAATTAAATAAKKGNTGLVIVIIVLVIAAAAAAYIILKKKQK